ncbi:MAG: EscU/YscU/HrcU family type III secretion system export apparatus switch protein [Acidobacteria bacterium]|nr:EscU/YscU/HrcU family type III secretion system export apparatus switch protein [Acidobacteriota bacterium]
MADSGERTEQPTQKRKEKARKEGQFAVSPEFLSSAYFGLCVTFLLVFSGSWANALVETMRRGLVQAADWDGTAPTMLAAMWQWSRRLAVPLMLAGLAAAATAVMLQLIQLRFGIATAKLAPDWGRLNPAQKAKSVWQRGAVQLLYSLVLLPVMGLILYSAVSGEWTAILRLPRQDLGGGLSWAWQWTRGLLMSMAGLFLVVGLVDLYRQTHKFNKGLRMSKQEIREEMKESEGNPMVKAKLRRLQRSLLRRKMVQDVPKATMVVVNPTHYAVALRYAPGESAAPRVLAKGRDHLALRIRKLANDHQIPIVENPPLAQALYKTAKVGHDIPPHLYRAVAEVLAYIYRVMQGRMPR